MLSVSTVKSATSFMLAGTRTYFRPKKHVKYCLLRKVDNSQEAKKVDRLEQNDSTNYIKFCNFSCKFEQAFLCK